MRLKDIKSLEDLHRIYWRRFTHWVHHSWKVGVVCQHSAVSLQGGAFQLFKELLLKGHYSKRRWTHRCDKTHNIEACQVWARAKNQWRANISVDERVTIFYYLTIWTLFLGMAYWQIKIVKVFFVFQVLILIIFIVLDDWQATLLVNLFFHFK